MGGALGANLLYLSLSHYAWRGETPGRVQDSLAGQRFLDKSLAQEVHVFFGISMQVATHCRLPCRTRHNRHELPRHESRPSGLGRTIRGGGSDE
jgi:hypothetical protein